MKNILQSRMIRALELMLAHAALLAALGGENSFAQGPYTWIPSIGNWAVPQNWTGAAGNYVPEGRLGEEAVIDNGGTAQISTVFDNSGAGTFGPGNIIIDNGTVEILATGAMTLDGLGRSVSVGGSGVGTLTIQPGGFLDAATLSSAANGSLVDLTGTASLSLSGPFNPGGITRINGPDVSFSANSIGFGSVSTYRAEITGATFSTINVAEGVSLAGTLDVNFGGVMPVIGDSWDLFSTGSGSVGAFSAITLNGIGGLDESLFGIRTLNNVVQLAVEQKLTLNVDHTTGEVTINNAGTMAVAFDGYTVHSPSGSLDNVTGWSPLQDNPSYTGWQVSESSNTIRVTETNAEGFSSLGNGSISLGNLYSPETASIAELGQDLADVNFQYVTLEGAIYDGEVTYTGDPMINNLVLTVDPTTGEGQISNPSLFPLSIDGYTITSSAQSLLDTWTGLEGNSNADPDWQRSESSSSQRLTESNPTGEEAFAALDGSAALSLGTIFDTAQGEPGQDLVFEFLLAAESDPRVGVVIYGELLRLEADFDEDGDVDGDDFLAWQTGFGTQSGAQKSDGDYDNDGDVDGDDFLGWQAEFGAGSGSANAAVPEPTSKLLLLVMAAVGMLSGRGGISQLLR